MSYDEDFLLVLLPALSYNQFHYIVKLADVLPNFSFTTSETMCNYYL